MSARKNRSRSRTRTQQAVKWPAWVAERKLDPTLVTPFKHKTLGTIVYEVDPHAYDAPFEYFDQSGKRVFTYILYQHVSAEEIKQTMKRNADWRKQLTQSSIPERPPQTKIPDWIKERKLDPHFIDICRHPDISGLVYADTEPRTRDGGVVYYDDQGKKLVVEHFSMRPIQDKTPKKPSQDKEWIKKVKVLQKFA